MQIDYHPGTQGCGPVWLELDGVPLPFTRGANPYRCGAAEIDREALRLRLAVPPADGVMHRLAVHLG